MTKLRSLVVAAKRFNGHELWTTLQVLGSHDIEYDVVSLEDPIADEITGRKVHPTFTFKTLSASNDVRNYDGLMFISGNMKDTEAHWNFSWTLRAVEEAEANKLTLAAICCSVPTIRKAAWNKRVSFFPLVRARVLLEQAGAILSNVSVSADDRLVTAEHQMATQTWAEVYSDVLQGKPPHITLVDSGFTPGGRVMKRQSPILTHIKEKFRV